MTMLKRLLALAVLVQASLFSVQEGGHIGARGGVAFLSESDISVKGAPTDRQDYDTGYSVSGFGGYTCDEGWRLELELAYRSHCVDSYLDSSTPVRIKSGIDGTVSSIGLLGNAYYFFDIDCAIEPYVGAGVGYHWVKVKDKATGTVIFNDRGNGFCGQLIGGATYPVCESCNLALDYRFLLSQDITVKIAGGGKADIEYMLHAISLGFEFLF